MHTPPNISKQIDRQSDMHGQKHGGWTDIINSRINFHVDLEYIYLVMALKSISLY